ncbi:murein L,D-transpeptidase catalytic domain family protein [Bacillus sp. NP157]|nr:murein L,D-transpeptidase catalytic domain family protein [Bacillus sp. NP157]
MIIPDFSRVPDLPPAIARQAWASAVCGALGFPPTHLLVADMSQPSLAPRLWVLDLSDPANPVLVLQTQVAHGFGSDPKRDGHATQFSDLEGSGMTSLGLYRIGAAYIGAHGRSYRLGGLSLTNAHAFARDVVLHPAAYVLPQHVGHSAGCAAVSAIVLPTLERRWGSLTGAYLYIAGPGLPIPHCAALNPQPWVLPNEWRRAFATHDACTPGDTI